MKYQERKEKQTWKYHQWATEQSQLPYLYV